MVDVSLRRSGRRRGADGLIDALGVVIGLGGHGPVNVGVRDDWSWVNERPEDERAELLVVADPFDRR